MVKALRQPYLLPVVLSAGSFLSLVLVVLLTNPLDKVGYSAVFFGLLFLFVLSLGWLVLVLRSGTVSSRARYRLVILTVFVVALLMFRSTGSLNFIDALILFLILWGLLFYGSRRGN